MAQFLVRSTRLTHGHPMVFPLFPRQHGEVTAFLNPDGQVAVVVRNLGFQNNSADQQKRLEIVEITHHQKNSAFGFLVVFLCDFDSFGKQSSDGFWGLIKVGCWDAVGCAAWAWRVPGAWCKKGGGQDGPLNTRHLSISAVLNPRKKCLLLLVFIIHVLIGPHFWT